MDAATTQQNRAAEPDASTWLSANAGSGKTRVLTDRVARLLLDKVAPANILCLTYTKAAASEMQNRLFRRLGAWAMKPDGALAEELAALGVADVHDPERLAEARRLFARAIETPGGLRIQTIHSFCASLLRRFPLEAGVTPGFVEMDDRATALLCDEILEELAGSDAGDTIDALAAQQPGVDLMRMVAAVVKNREALRREAGEAEILDWFGLPPGYSAEELLEEAFDGSEAGLFAALLPVLNESDKVTDQRAAVPLQRHDWANPDHLALEALIGLVLYGETAKAPFGAKIGYFPTKASRERLGGHCDDLNDLMQRIEAVRGRRNSLYAARKTHALYRFAQAFLPLFEARKTRRGWLDFDDLILRTRALLSNELVAGWVLYRLDGGLDHILVDEAQDTSPAQWQVIERLAQEFTSGIGARDDTRRTIFVVGDKKQSIYSFQGADPREFDRMRAHFDGRLRAVEDMLRPMELEYSFRSSEAVLRFVDIAVATDGAKHRAFHANLPGRVDLWPPVEKWQEPEKRLWYDPVDIKAEDHSDVVLARQIADEIGRMVETETIPAGNGGRRRVRAGDVLILVRRRSGLFQEIIRACKARGLPVAGADRLKLGAELAVRDVAALLSFVATPEDDLSLAAALRSPLLGWTERDLYGLAAERGEIYLWAALRQREAEFPETMAMLHDLRNGADFLRPYDLIERILTRHDGRRRLLARLGPEAEDGIDALLAQSLSYERMEVPSLTGFLTWMETDDVEIKRQMDSAGDQIRVMTVHGAKGLESPIVILPDTARRPARVRDEVIALAGERMAWRGPAKLQPEAMRAATERIKADQAAEEERLFYVAVTRAETWLIVAASGEVGGPGESWHQTAEAALRQLGYQDLDAPTGPGLRYAHGDWGAGAVEPGPAEVAGVTGLPDWATARIAPPKHPPKTLAPSGLGGAKALGGAGAQDEAAAKRYGSMLHKLLEVLPPLPAADWPGLAEKVLAASEFGAGPEEAGCVLTETRRVLEADEFAFLFKPEVLSEADISAHLAEFGGDRVAGAIDKLVVTPDRVLAVDFKTNAIVPGRPEETPLGILRQMGAYHCALQAVFPDRAVEVAILWTRTPRLMPLPHEIVRRALRDPATS
ncbi:MAG: double-strand break repair helicase AddA [Rhodobacteraceae bacterium]|nr:double-strand break repair helicase AddA [Paracoccaceae bacterium]